MAPLAEIASETSGHLLMLDTFQPVSLISVPCRLIQSTTGICLLCMREEPSSNSSREGCYTELSFCDSPRSVKPYRIEYNTSSSVYFQKEEFM